MAFALWTTPIGPLERGDRLSAFLRPDVATYVAVQRYFLADGWRWPLLQTALLMPPHGVNVAFADAIPIALLPAKLLRAWLPPNFDLVRTWMMIERMLQPVAAVFALRATGVRAAAPQIAAAIIAVSIPVWLAQDFHVALDSHFLLLAALGLYLLLVRDTAATALQGPLWGAGTLMAATLLIHVYLLLMVTALLFAAPLTLLLRRDRRFLQVSAGLAAGAIVTLAMALALGYADFGDSIGFGYFSMNLLSIVDPSTSSLLPHLIAPVDATGGQYEGFQYLGVGLWVLALAAAWLALRTLGPAKRHPGLVVVAVLMILLALSNRIYLGRQLLVDIPAPHFLEQVRSSGRFFWPVTYIIAIGAIATVGKLLQPRLSGPLLLACALLQAADTAGQRVALHATSREIKAWTIDVSTLRPLIAPATQLDVWPEQACGGIVSEEFSELMLLASATHVPITDSIYLARQPHDFRCADREASLTPLRAGEVRVFLPEAGPLRAPAGWRDFCRVVGPFSVCAEALRGRKDLRAPIFTPPSPATSGSAL
ncbi:MAG: hypothetical protein JO127_19120 [Caulobacteraceae bacterium]|nr:hypothetical protein [Caulobacteraceae bacterium]